MKPDADRHQLHIEALGIEKSSKDFTNHDLDRVLAVFRTISRPASMTSQIRQLGQRRTRMEYKINEHIRCLALYVPNAPAYAEQILRERFRVGTIEELGESPSIRRTATGVIEGNAPLLQYLMTLAARVNAARNKAGDTLHEMKTRAGVECDCKECIRLAPQAPDTMPDPETVAVGAIDDNNPY